MSRACDDKLGSKADHDGPRSACSVRGLQSALLRNPVRASISKNERHWATEKICGKNIKENHAERG